MLVNGYEIKPEANLGYANLRNADLRYADLRGANLRNANLMGADLMGADLRNADLRNANLMGADLRGANLRNADLRNTNLEKALLPHFQICPKEGSFIAWKKTRNGIVKLLIPEDAKRTSSLVGRKCRASYVKVLEGQGAGLHDRKYTYSEGQFVYPDKYDDDIRVACTHGIHFFMTRKEAEEYR